MAKKDKHYTCAFCGKRKKNGLLSPTVFDSGEYICWGCTLRIQNTIDEKCTDYTNMGKVFGKHISGRLISSPIGDVRNTIFPLDLVKRLEEDPARAMEIMSEVIEFTVYTPKGKVEIGDAVIDKDEETITFTMPPTILGGTSTESYPLSSIKSYEYFENAESIARGGSGIGRAIVGGALFGGVGAVVGATSAKSKYTDNKVHDMKILVTLKDNNGSYITRSITIVGNADFLYKDSDRYQKKYSEILNAIAALDEAIASEPETTPEPEQKSTESSMEDISKSLISLKQLLDSGIITQEEFDAKKKQLLGL